MEGSLVSGDSCMDGPPAWGALLHGRLSCVWGSPAWGGALSGEPHAWIPAGGSDRRRTGQSVLVVPAHPDRWEAEIGAPLSYEGAPPRLHM